MLKAAGRSAERLLAGVLKDQLAGVLKDQLAGVLKDKLEGVLKAAGRSAE